MDRKYLAALYLFFASLYLATTPGHLYTVDSVVSYQTTESLVERGSLEVEWSHITVPDAEGRSTGRYGLVQMILCIPLYLAGDAMDALFPSPTFLYENWRVTLVATFNQWVAPIALLFFYAILRAFDFSHRACFAATISLGFATPWWTYSRDLFRQPIAGVFFLWAVWGILRFGRVRGSGPLLQSAAAIGLSFWNRITSVVAWPGLFFLLLSRLWGENRKTILRVCVAVAVLAALGIAAQIATNYWRFGHWWGWAYENRQFRLEYIPRNLPDLLLSPARGLLLFCPPLVFVFHGVAASWKRDRGLTAAILLMFGGKMAMLATYSDYTGGMNPGPRYLIPILPVLYLLVGMVVGAEWRQRSFRWAFYLFAAVGVIANGFNSVTPYNFTLTFWDQASRYLGIEPYEGSRPWQGRMEFYDVLVGKWMIDGHWAPLILYLGALAAILTLCLRAILPILRGDSKESTEPPAT